MPTAGLTGAGAPQAHVMGAGGIWGRRAPRSKAFGRRGQVPVGRPRPRAAGSRIAASVVLRTPYPRPPWGLRLGQAPLLGPHRPGHPLHDPNSRVPRSRPSSESLPRLGAPWAPQGPTWTCSGSWLSERKRKRRFFLRSLETGDEDQAWMEEEETEGGGLLLCPPQTPSAPSGWAPARKPADSSVRTAGSRDSAAICYLMRK